MKWIKELCRNTIRFFRKRRVRAEYIDLALGMNKVVKLAHECVKYSYELTRYKYDEQGKKRTIEEYGQKVFEFENATREFNNKIYDINEDEWQGIKSSRYVEYISKESFHEYSDEIGQQSKKIRGYESRNRHKGAWQDTSPGSFYAPHPLISMHLVDID